MSLDEVQRAYDIVAADYARLLEGDLESDPHDRAALRLFADLVGAGAAVLDAGCGTGRITRHLTDLGLDARGVDPSPGMLAVAREQHPDLSFDTGSIGSLDVPDASLDGVVAWYSIIHTPPEQQAALMADLARVIRPGGYLLLGYKVGDRVVRIDSAYGHDDLGYDVFWMRPEDVEQRLADAGLLVESSTLRRADRHQHQPQAYVIARRGWS